MKKEDYLRHVGNMQQLASISQRTEASSQRICTLDNGVLRFDILLDSGMDIGTLAYKGQNVAFLSKPAFGKKSSLDTGSRSISGGMMFTCGLRNVGPPDRADDALHGRIRNTSAEHLCSQSFWRGNSYRLELQGEMREAGLFGENLLLKRKITSKYQSSYLRVFDEIENQGFKSSPFMLLYHINIGYPLLDKNAVFYAPAYHSEARDEISSSGINNWYNFSEPIDSVDEEVFYHRLCSDDDGMTVVALVNRPKNLALYLRYNVEQLPVLCQWKSMQSGDYVLGIEPANCVPEGRARVQKRGMLRTLQPLEASSFKWKLGFCEGSQIDSLIDEIETLRRSGQRS